MIMGDKPAYSLGPHSVSPLRRLAGGCAPSDPQAKPPLRQRSRLGGSEGPPGRRSRRMFSRRRPDHRRSACPSASRLSPRSDRRATWSGVATASAPVPPASGTDSVRSSRRGRVPSPPRTEGGRSGSHPNVPVGREVLPMPLAFPASMPLRNVHSTYRVDSHFGPPTIHTCHTAYPPARQRLASRRPVRPLENGPLGRWLERPPSPRARYGVGPSVCSHPRRRLQGSLQQHQSVPEGCRAPLRGSGGPVGRPAGRHRRSRPKLHDGCHGGAAESDQRSDDGSPGVRTLVDKRSASARQLRPIVRSEQIVGASNGIR